MQRGNINILLVVIIILLVGFGAYYFGKQSVQNTPPNITPSSQPTTTSASPSDETANWETYNNSEFSYSIDYPSNWTASQSIFSSPDRAKDDQVFHVDIFAEKSDKTPLDWLKQKDQLDIGGNCCYHPNVTLTKTAILEDAILYKVITDQSKYPVYITSKNGVIVYINSSAGYPDGGTYYYDETDSTLMKNIETVNQMVSTFKFTK